MTTNASMYRNGGLYGAHTIIESATGYPVDVVIGLTLTFGLVSRWESANPGVSFESRASIAGEEDNAHNIQIDARNRFVVPAESL